MELLLNLVWGLIVATAAVRFAIWRPGQPARRKFVVALATVCVLAILFPIISVTDDLRRSPAVFEETRTAAIGLASAVAIPVAVAVFACRLRPIRAITDEPVHLVLDGVTTVLSVRPPPVFVR